MGNKVKCWENFHCREIECPAYRSKELNCWMISGTHCREEIQGKFLEKMEMCLDCEPLKKNMDKRSMEETLRIINEQFKQSQEMVKKRDKELEDIGMELAIGLSESFEMLRKLSSGNPTVRISITSKNELIAKLESELNKTAESIEEMVNQHHELAMGICEHYDALAKTAAGDRTSRAPENSQNELIAKLGRLINEETSSLTELIQEIETTSLELALGLSENFEVLKKVAEGDLTVRAPEKSKNELLAKLGIVVNQTIAQIQNSWEKLLKSENKYRTLTENINIGIYRNTPGSKGRFIEVNPAIVRMFGYNDKKAFLKLNVSDLYMDPRGRDETNKKILVNGFLKDEEILLKKKDGTPFWGSVTATIVFDEKEEVAYYDGAVKDITKQKNVDAKIRASLQEKEVLLKEIHHRVKNNLQIINSLLSLQSRHIQDDRILQMFQECRNRIRSMALVHEKLYQSKNFSNIDFAEYIKGLANSLFRAYKTDPGLVTLNIDVENIALSPDLAVPCGLIINELVSNTLKYAFPLPFEGNGKITIALHPARDSEVELIVKDNGVGIPSDLDTRNTNSLGLQLVHVLAEDQLDGTIHLDRSNGTMFQIKFKAN